jgi:Homing endonuclease associated repeat/HNH endonuclease
MYMEYIITKEKISQDLKNISEKISKTPISKSEYELHGLYSITSVRRIFGSWNKALTFTFNKVLQQKIKKSIIKCKNCGKDTKNQKFCSRSCAVTITNKTPKRKLEGNCKCCSKSIKSQNIYCKECRLYVKIIGEKTLKEVIYRTHHRSSAFSLIRTRARAIAKKLGVKSCQNCDYSKTIQIGHKKAINLFSEDTLISEINSLTNLIALCPNCHWEFDHNLLQCNKNLKDCSRLDSNQHKSA